jgi:hypothetical protein
MTFADLEWRPNGDGPDDFIQRWERDPAFTVKGYTRWVAFARICGEIRVYAGPLPQGAWPWYWSGEDPERAAAVDAEPESSEMGVLMSVEDAVKLTFEYLGGTPLEEIGVSRRRLGTK